jgi:hypothetical protein
MMTDEELQILRCIENDNPKHHDAIAGLIARLTRERDEARNEAEALRRNAQIVRRVVSERDQMQHERDEARAALHNLHDDLYEEHRWLLDTDQMKEALRALAARPANESSSNP